jgi:hypothetical protein
LPGSLYKDSNKIAFVFSKVSTMSYIFYNLALFSDILFKYFSEFLKKENEFPAGGPAFGLQQQCWARQSASTAQPKAVCEAGQTVPDCGQGDTAMLANGR